jgi:hypothetical protein
MRISLDMFINPVSHPAGGFFVSLAKVISCWGTGRYPNHEISGRGRSQIDPNVFLNMPAKMDSGSSTDVSGDPE